MTTTAFALLYQNGSLDLSTLPPSSCLCELISPYLSYSATPLSDSALLGQAYAVNGKQAITSLNLLLHNAGFAPDPVPGYCTDSASSVMVFLFPLFLVLVEPSFGCPQVKISPPPQSFACQEAIYKAMMNLKPINPPGAVFLYSDLRSLLNLSHRQPLDHDVI